MKSDLHTSFSVFSPRWGHSDDYSLIFTFDEISITNTNTFNAKCTEDEFGYYHWTGYNENIGNALMEIFSNDNVYPPSVIPFAVQYAWKSWKEGTPDVEILQAIDDLFEWVDTVARAKPKSEFWIGAF